MFEERLEKLAAAIGGVRGLCLVAQDGICVEALEHDDRLDLEALGAEVLTMVRRISDLDREPSVGRVRAFSITGERMTVVVQGVTEMYYLLAALDDATRLGRARFELRRARIAFEPDLV